jgi:cell shape-determining protein MreD
VVAPLIPSIVFFYFAGVMSSFVYSYGVSYVLGIPTFLILRRLKKEEHLYYASAGFILGALYILVSTGPDPQFISVAFSFGLLGFLVALCFSVIRGSERRA